MAEQLICNHQVVGSIPIDGTRSSIEEGHVPSFKLNAPMAELADALDLGSSGVTRTGSIPARCTSVTKKDPLLIRVLFFVFLYLSSSDETKDTAEDIEDVAS